MGKSKASQLNRNQMAYQRLSKKAKMLKISENKRQVAEERKTS